MRIEITSTREGGDAIWSVVIDDGVQCLELVCRTREDASALREKLADVIEAHSIEEVERMTAAQYRKILARLGINQQEAGRLLGVSRRTAQNWAAVGPPKPVGRLLALVVRHGIPLEELGW